MPIVSPGGEQAELFRNRKGYFSINVQAVCDADGKFIDFICRWHGSAHDQTILNHSVIKTRFEQGEFGNGLLLGDSGYAVKNYLLTPLRNPLTIQERKYNKNHIKLRHYIESNFGIWKRRFPILYTRMRNKLLNNIRTILATAILHNIAIILNEPEPPPEEIDIDLIYLQPVPIEILHNHNRSDTRIRNEIIQNM